jgi:glucan biosynthesis protein C
MGVRKERLHYLDAFRAFCMLYGVFLHAPVIVGDPTGGWVETGSSYFRMPGFFIISGFFSAMVLQRMMDFSLFLRQRLILLMVPFLTVLILANPLTLILLAQHYGYEPPLGVAAFFSAKMGPGGIWVWHLHLWFLISLAVYTLCLPLACGLVVWLRPVLTRIETWPAFAAIGTLALATGVACVAGRAAASILDQTLLRGMSGAYIFIATLRFAPFFVLGVVFFRQRALLKTFSAGGPILWGVGLALLVTTDHIFGAVESTAAQIVVVLVKSTVTVIFVSALFRIFKALFSKGNPVVRFLVDASFTLYLLHFFFVTAFGILILPLMGPLGFGTWAAYILVVLATIGTSLALHGMVIARSGTLRFLFNGKRKRL